MVDIRVGVFRLCSEKGTESQMFKYAMANLNILSYLLFRKFEIKSVLLNPRTNMFFRICVFIC